MTTAAGRDAELTALGRSFRIGMVAVAAFLIAVGGIVAAWGSNADRPAGIAERWLVALSDTTRDGLEDDALERMAEHQFGGFPAEDDPLLGFPDLRDDRGAAADGEARFDTVRVGRAFRSLGDDAGADFGPELAGFFFPGAEDAVLVPVEVTPYEADDPVDGYVLMVEDDGWKVGTFAPADFLVDLGAYENLDAVCPGGDCPGFPIERPERAPLGFLVGTLALGALIAAGCSFAAKAATPKPPAATPAPTGS